MPCQWLWIVVGMCLVYCVLHIGSTVNQPSSKYRRKRLFFSSWAKDSLCQSEKKSSDVMMIWWEVSKRGSCLLKIERSSVLSQNLSFCLNLASKPEGTSWQKRTYISSLDVMFPAVLTWNWNNWTDWQTSWSLRGDLLVPLILWY